MALFSYVTPFYWNTSMCLSNVKLFLLLHFYLNLALGCTVVEVSLTASCSGMSVPVGQLLWCRMGCRSLSCRSSCKTP